MDAASTVDWCEGNYEIVSFISEFWNTVSSFVLLYAGAYGFFQHSFDNKGVQVFLLLGIVGIGSIFFHGTLTLFTQMLDEIPMVFLIIQLMLNTINVPKYTTFAYFYASLYSILLILSSFAVYKNYVLQFYLFQISVFISAIAIMISLIKVGRTSIIRYLFRKGISFFLLGWVCWLIDYFLCKQVPEKFQFNPQFHAWWHILSACGVYNLSLISILSRNGSKHFIIHKGYFFPVLKKISDDASKLC